MLPAFSYFYFHRQISSFFAGFSAKYSVSLDSDAQHYFRHYYGIASRFPVGLFC